MPGCWQEVACCVSDFAARHALEPHDIIVLLPFAQHLPLARAAWALQAGQAAWLPRFETTETLARSLAPAPPAEPGALAFDATADALRCAELLSERAADWPKRDPRSFDRAVAQVVDTAHALCRARLALPPARRAAWLEAARSEIGAGAAAGPGGRERALAQLALEWSLGADSTAADLLHAQRPGAWVALGGGASDALVESLLGCANVPVLWLHADTPDASAFEVFAGVRLATCGDFEDEAQRSAAQVLWHLARGEAPVALIALDRVLLRRVRALLERQSLRLCDETGWRLSTTRAAATVVGLLRAAEPRAATDALLDWMKSAPRAWAGLDALESYWRRHGVHSLRQAGAAPPEGEPLALWHRWQAVEKALLPAGASRRLALADWLMSLRQALQQAGLWQSLEGDAAGAQVLDALRCRADAGTPAWLQQSRRSHFDAAGFAAWVAEVLERTSYAPPLGGDAAPQVVITPLARAVLRPFAAIVCPGADDSHLGANPLSQPLLGDALAGKLGLPTTEQMRHAERRAFSQLLRSAPLALLHRQRDGSEPVQPSVLLQRLQLAALRSGQALAELPEVRVLERIEPQSLPRPLPVAPQLLPTRMNATAYEALRACPYRFFAERMLALGEAEELDDALEKRDYGSWLHTVLQAFHTQRPEAAGDADARTDDERLLRAIARQHQHRLDRDDADFLPYAAWFERLAPLYLHWLHGQEALGMRVLATELALEARPLGLAALGLELAGRLDRLDALPTAHGPSWRILDYKAKTSAALREQLREPLEDTQLAFYAALLEGARPLPPGGLAAAYLALDGREGALVLAHSEVQASAARLLEGLADDFTRLAAGAALPALGEGSACTHCRARGLCRRDHWGEAAP